MTCSCPDCSPAEDYQPCECNGKGCEGCDFEGGHWYGEAMSRFEFERRVKRIKEDTAAEAAY